MNKQKLVEDVKTFLLVAIIFFVMGAIVSPIEMRDKKLMQEYEDENTETYKKVQESMIKKVPTKKEKKDN